MNKWLYRAVGAMGVASGALLLSNGVAHAQAANDARPDFDPQAMHGVVAEFFTPLWQQHLEEAGLLGGGGGLGGLTGGGSGGLTGGLTGGLGGGLGGIGSGGSGLLGGLTGGKGPVGGLTGGLTGAEGAGPLAALTKGKAGGPLGGLLGADGLLGGLTSGDGLAGIIGALTGKGDTAKADKAEQPVTGPSNNLNGSADAVAADPADAWQGDAWQSDAGQDDAWQSDPLDMGAVRNIVGSADGVVEGPNRTGSGANAGSGSGTGAGASSLSDTVQDTTATATAQQPDQRKSDMARRVNDATASMVQAVIANAVAKRMGLPTDAAQDEESQESKHRAALDRVPGLSEIMGPDGPLKDILAVGDVLNGKAEPGDVAKVPVIRDILGQALQSSGTSASLPVVGGIPFIGDALGSLGNLGPQTMAAATDDAPTSVPTASTATPPAIPPVGAVPMGAALSAAPSLLPATVSPRAASAVPVPRPADTQSVQRAAQPPVHVGRHRATDRPEVADPELEASPAPASLPLSTLMRGVPLVEDVPLIGGLGSPMAVLNELPLVGSLTGLVPVESDTAA